MWKAIEKMNHSHFSLKQGSFHLKFIRLSHSVPMKLGFRWKCAQNNHTYTDCTMIQILPTNFIETQKRQFFFYKNHQLYEWKIKNVETSLYMPCELRV